MLYCSMEEKDFWIGFSVFSGVGSATFQSLREKFGNAKTAWSASPSDLKVVLKEKKTKDFLEFREIFNFQAYKERLKREKVSIITLEDPTYPPLLKKIPKPPFVLYVKGDSVILGTQSEAWRTPGSDSGRARMTIAIVGTRKITQYGRDVTEIFTQELVRAGCVIVSGLAMGVDAVAHETTIRQEGKTIAVLGCGVDCCYPRENQKIYDAILMHGGAIVSEIPLGVSATVGTFPARNRIVAGLSESILVTQGTQDSGALITAEFGIQYGRKVFAVPGPITSDLSGGPYKLIEQGAKLVTRPEDILQELRIQGKSIKGITSTKSIKGDTKEEQEILDLLQNEEMSFDEIVRKVQRDSSHIASLVSLMEIKGLIKSNGTGGFSIVK